MRCIGPCKDPAVGLKQENMTWMHMLQFCLPTSPGQQGAQSEPQPAWFPPCGLLYTPACTPTPKLKLGRWRPRHPALFSVVLYSNCPPVTAPTNCHMHSSTTIGTSKSTGAGAPLPGGPHAHPATNHALIPRPAMKSRLKRTDTANMRSAARSPKSCGFVQHPTQPCHLCLSKKSIVLQPQLAIKVSQHASSGAAPGQRLDRD